MFLEAYFLLFGKNDSIYRSKYESRNRIWEKIGGFRISRTILMWFLLAFKYNKFITSFMLSFKPVMLTTVNENLFSASQEVDGPFLLSRERPSNFKCDMKNADWTIIEIARYVDFIQQNTNKMEGKAHKQLWSVY